MEKNGFIPNTTDLEMSSEDIERKLNKVRSRIHGLNVERDRQMDAYREDGKYSHLAVVDVIDASIKKEKEYLSSLTIGDIINQ